MKSRADVLSDTDVRCKSDRYG